MGPVNPVTVERCSEKGGFGHSSNHILRSQELREYLSDEAELFFQNPQNFMQISKMHRNLKRCYWVGRKFRLNLLQEFLSDLTTTDVIGCQCVKNSSKIWDLTKTDVFQPNFSEINVKLGYEKVALQVLAVFRTC